VIREAVLVQGNRPTAPSPTFAGVRAWIVLGMLWFVYVLNFLDRQLLAILAKPIQYSLHVSDRQLGLIGGLYFALSTASGWPEFRMVNSRRLPIHSLLFALSK
jgi:hypothetical protein